MKKLRLTAIAALVAIAAVGSTQAAKSLQAVTFWYDAQTNVYMGSTASETLPPAGCEGSLELCANGRAVQNPTAPIIATAHKD